MIMKKGMSQIIAYVLIISLAVALAVFVTIWYRGVVEEQADIILTPAAGSAECDQVNVNINFNYTHCYLMVYNAGKLKIEKVNIIALAGSTVNELSYNVDLLPKQWNKTLDLMSSDVTQVEVFPVIRLNSQLYSCQKNKIFESKESFDPACGVP